MASKKINLLPEYDNPPLIEVVCGVTFQPLNNFIATHFGILWNTFQPAFPKVDEVAPLASPIEIVEGQSFESQLEFTNIPPLPRQMFSSQDERNVIQVQRDRFLYNWRKLVSDDTYPRFETVFSEFKNKLNVFNDFLKSGGLELKPIQYELTYVNHIVEDKIWKNTQDLSKVFNNFSFETKSGLILGEPETINSRISYLLPNNLGRLYATIRTGGTRKIDNKKVILFDLTARGFNHNNNLADMDEWFKLGREWIVNGFTDLTGEKIQKETWKRRQ